MERYHLLHAVRADLLAKPGEAQQARRAYERTAELTHNVRERGLLRERARALQA